MKTHPTIPARQALKRAGAVLATIVVSVIAYTLLGPLGAGATLIMGAMVGLNLEAEYSQEGDKLDYTPGSDITGGTVEQLADGRTAIANSDIASGVQGARRVTGVYRFAAASGTTWSDGDEVYWDASASEAVPKSAALDGSADHYLGIAVGDKASGVTHGEVQINVDRPLKPIRYEFDVSDDNGDTDEHVLIPAEQNPHGLVITNVFARITEQMAGDTEDQGIVTVEDEDDNAITTLTPSDAAADAVGDIVVGYQIQQAATGDALNTVAAGKAVQGFVSQQTSGGTPAGKMVVYVEAVSLI